MAILNEFLLYSIYFGNNKTLGLSQSALTFGSKVKKNISAH